MRAVLPRERTTICVRRSRVRVDVRRPRVENDVEHDIGGKLRRYSGDNGIIADVTSRCSRTTVASHLACDVRESL
jgi:hypothetical protein